MFSLYVVKAQDTVAKDTVRNSGYRIICFASVTPEKPLYILNGKVISEEAANNINPKKITEINVLKDASATALYGIKGSKGVIIISTKKKKTKK